MGNRSVLGVIVAIASLSLVGCDEDLASIRITLHRDGSGTVKVYSVTVPEQPGAAERDSRGVRWSDRVSVSAEAGAFTDLSLLAVSDITCDRTAREGTGSLEVVVPLGTHSQWAAALAPLSDAQRTGLAKVFDPTGRAESIGSSLQIVVEFPGEVVSSGAIPETDGISASHKATTATLTVPVGATALYHDSVRWHVTWTQ